MLNLSFATLFLVSEMLEVLIVKRLEKLQHKKGVLFMVTIYK